jgi:branched-chain amino acid transport system permease protein
MSIELHQHPRAYPVGKVLLSVENVSLSFGGVNALTDISFDVREHEVRAIIGPNGAGKSSMLNVLNGVYHPQKGTIRLRGKSFHDMVSHEAAAMGIARTFQNIALFKGMTVLDNILTGRNLKMRSNFLQQALWWGPARREELVHRHAVEEVIDFLEIQHIRKTPVGRLPYGLQKRVELARALAAEPKILLLDEPMAGMNLEEKQDMCRFVLDVNDHYGTTIVLIEHDMGVVMDISDRVVVLDYVALGFVLIYKASGVFNFAQGAMVFLAALTFVSLLEMNWNFWIALLVTLVVMVAVGVLTERIVLRPLVNQPPITLFMATIGLTFVLEGLSQLVWGSQPHALELGIEDVPMEWLSQKWNINISKFDLFAAAVSGLLVASLALFFQKTRIGRALRAVADDHQAALAVGISLQHIWAIVWAVAGFVALVAGMMWGVRNGVQYALTFTALKALPVLILGGFESVPGAIIGGLIIGASEKVAEVYLGPYVGGGIESWFAYVIALLFLLVRPQGLFGEKIIDRV